MAIPLLTSETIPPYRVEAVCQHGFVTGRSPWPDFIDGREARRTGPTGLAKEKPGRSRTW